MLEVCDFRENSTVCFVINQIVGLWNMLLSYNKGIHSNKQEKRLLTFQRQPLCCKKKMTWVVFEAEI